MIEALIAGRRSPQALAELARGRARVRRDALAEALDGRFTDHHARLARMLLGQLDDLSARIVEVTALLDAAITALPGGATSVEAPGTERPGPTATSYACAIQRLCAIPGAGPDTIRAIIGEIGLDMTVFGRHQRLCSWAKWRASQIPDRGPNKVPPGMEGDECRRNGGNTALSSRLRRRGWWFRRRGQLSMSLGR
jgi:transposase